MACNRPLATLTPAGSSTAEPWWHVRFGVDASAGDWTVLYVVNDGAGRAFLEVARAGDCYRLRFAGGDDFFVSPGSGEISCPATGHPAALEQLLVDQVLPRGLHARAEPCLHASAVALGGCVIAFVGEAGAGKSTLSAAMCRHAGATLVCDDALIVDPATLTVAPIYASVRLLPESAAALCDGGGDLEAASPRTSKLRVPLPTAVGTAQLVALVLLTNPQRPGNERPGNECSEDAPLALTRLRPRAAFAALAPAIHRLDGERADAVRAEYHLLTSLCDRLPVWRARVPRDFRALPEVVARLAQLGATEPDEKRVS